MTHSRRAIAFPHCFRRQRPGVGLRSFRSRSPWQHAIARRQKARNANATETELGRYAAGRADACGLGLRFGYSQMNWRTRSIVRVVTSAPSRSLVTNFASFIARMPNVVGRMDSSVRNASISDRNLSCVLMAREVTGVFPRTQGVFPRPVWAIPMR